MRKIIVLWLICLLHMLSMTATSAETPAYPVPTGWPSVKTELFMTMLNTDWSSGFFLFHPFHQYPQHPAINASDTLTIITMPADTASNGGSSIYWYATGSQSSRKRERQHSFCASQSCSSSGGGGGQKPNSHGHSYSRYCILCSGCCQAILFDDCPIIYDDARDSNPSEFDIYLSMDTNFTAALNQESTGVLSDELTTLPQATGHIFPRATILPEYLLIDYLPGYYLTDTPRDNYCWLHAIGWGTGSNPQNLLNQLLERIESDDAFVRQWRIQQGPANIDALRVQLNHGMWPDFSIMAPLLAHILGRPVVIFNLHTTDFTADQRFTYVESGHYEVSYSPQIEGLNFNPSDALFLGWLMRENHYVAISRETHRCSVCRETFPSPSDQGMKVHNTLCFHYFCQGCLMKLPRVAANPNAISCPVCRRVTASCLIFAGKRNQVTHKCYQGVCDFSCTSKKNLMKHHRTPEHRGNEPENKKAKKQKK